jgi:hypothetical protein
MNTEIINGSLEVRGNLVLESGNVMVKDSSWVYLKGPITSSRILVNGPITSSDIWIRSGSISVDDNITASNLWVTDSVLIGKDRKPLTDLLLRNKNDNMVWVEKDNLKSLINRIERLEETINKLVKNE